MTRDIRWLLFGAWPFASIALWVALNSFVYKKFLTTIGSDSALLLDSFSTLLTDPHPARDNQIR